MKRAFTLIELLVVIAIIAILAAILFPVFAQAKVAAKKTVAISNQKQISLSTLIYLGDYDDRYPMRSGCELNSSINPKLNDGVLRCSGGTGFGHSMTWQTWQKYIMPYMKNVEIYEHPLRIKDQNQWDTNGQILNAFAINLAIFGAATSVFTSTPWTGGTQTGINNVGRAFILMELPHSYAAPFAVQTGGPPEQTVYPMAIREYWRAIFLRNAGGCNTTEEIDPIAAPAGGIALGMADGSAKFYQIKKFLAETPTLNEYVPGASLPGPMGSNCRAARSAYNYSGGPAIPNIDLDAPLWGLGR
ncbi:prepilin-type N-terminal cleavage/methylation domain-containing protein [Kamptonema cortianum]|nr:prepilin-type N-terminal cleavage/methylation domain-containing protein [Geitlerinema splendidum]MDK3162252.1 prepilin-type N-terminal cleavage/methylation domain-containing protein [Kamptonema cortianum]